MKGLTLLYSETVVPLRRFSVSIISMPTSRPLSLRFMLCPRLSPVLHRRRLLGMPRGIPAGRGAAGARGMPRRGAVGAAPRRDMPRGLATRDMRGLASLVIFLTNLLIGFLLALA